jgi:hypothetical protein
VIEERELDALALVGDGLHREERAERRELAVPEARRGPRHAKGIVGDVDDARAHGHVDGDLAAHAQLAGVAAQLVGREVLLGQAGEDEVEAVAEGLAERGAGGAAHLEIARLDGVLAARVALARGRRGLAPFEQRGGGDELEEAGAGGEGRRDVVARAARGPGEDAPRARVGGDDGALVGAGLREQALGLVLEAGIEGELRLAAAGADGREGGAAADPHLPQIDAARRRRPRRRGGEREGGGEEAGEQDAGDRTHAAVH